jgi:hypothetical protein
VKLLALVVIFKRRLQDSRSLITLGVQSNPPAMHLIVWDNSPEPRSREDREWLNATFSSCEYLHSSENLPLSHLYNEVINRWIKRRQGEFSHLLLLDDDSQLDPAFLSVAAHSIREFPHVGLFLPIITARGRIVSPAHLIWVKGIHWRRAALGLIRFKFKTAVNSGMIITSRYLRDKFPGYPSSLSFYGTDNWFCDQYSRLEEFAVVFNSIIQHDLSQFNVEEVDVKLWRHRDWIRGLRVTNSAGFLRRQTCRIYTMLTCLRMVIRFRDRRFFDC